MSRFMSKQLLLLLFPYCIISKKCVMKGKLCPRWVIIWVSTEEESSPRYSLWVDIWVQAYISYQKLLVLTIYNGWLSSTCNQLWRQFFFFNFCREHTRTIIRNALNKSSKGSHSFRGRTDNWVLFQTSSNQKNLQREVFPIRSPLPQKITYSTYE